MTEQENATGREGRERDMGYTPLPDAPQPEAKTYAPGDDGIREAANDVTDRRGGPSDEPVISRPYVDANGERIRQKFSVTLDKAASDLSERHKAEAEVNELVDNFGIEASVLEARQRAAQAVSDARTSAEAWAPTDQTSQQSEQQPSDTPAAPDGVDPEIHSALQNPKVRAFVEAEVSQAYQARAAYAQAISDAQAALPSIFLAAVPELSNIPREHISTALQVIATQNPQRHAQIQRQIEAQFETTRAIQQRGAAIQQENQKQAQQHFETWATQQDFEFEKMYPEFADKEKAPALRASVAQYLTETVGIPRESSGQLWNSDLVRDAMSQKIIWDAAQWNAAKEKARTAVPVDLPPVQRPGVSQGHRHDAYEHVEDLRGQLRNTSGEAQMRLATKMIQAKREARR